MQQLCGEDLTEKSGNNKYFKKNIMSKFTPYALKTLPSSGIDVRGMYFIKGDNETRFRIYLRKNDNSDWVQLGTSDSVDSVNDLTGDVKIDLELDSGKLKIVATGTGTASTVTEIDLDSRYRRTGVSIPWSEITGAPNFAIDSEVVHIAGAETITGVKTFSQNTNVPLAPTSNAHATSKKYVDDEIDSLQSQINDIETVIGTGLLYIDDIDASGGVNYPINPDGGTKKGNLWIVKTEGHINGIQVDTGNLVIAKKDDAGVTNDADWTIIQADLDQATELIKGFARIATNAETDAGTNDETIITPKKLQRKIDQAATDNQTAGDLRYVRYNTSAQGLSSAQRLNARTNIKAADDDAVVKLTGNQTVAGTKTFSSIPVLPSSNPTSNNQATRKKYVDDQITEAVSWGGSNGKEW